MSFPATFLLLPLTPPTPASSCSCLRASALLPPGAPSQTGFYFLTSFRFGLKRAFSGRPSRTPSLKSSVDHTASHAQDSGSSLSRAAITMSAFVGFAHCCIPQTQNGAWHAALNNHLVEWTERTEASLMEKAEQQILSK